MPIAGDWKQGSRICCARALKKHAKTQDRMRNFLIFTSKNVPSLLSKDTIQTPYAALLSVVILVLFLTRPAIAQIDSLAKVKADSLKEQLELQRKKVNAFSDSLSIKATRVTDSLNRIRAKATALLQVKDTLKLVNRLDSLQGRMESIPDVDRLFCLTRMLSRLIH